MNWRRSSHCATDQATEQCVEARRVPTGFKELASVELRSSRSPRRVIDLTASEWRAFLQGVKDGEFDDLA